jgi:hypothetical protein
MADLINHFHGFIGLFLVFKIVRQACSNLFEQCGSQFDYSEECTETCVGLAKPL